MSLDCNMVDCTGMKGNGASQGGDRWLKTGIRISTKEGYGACCLGMLQVHMGAAFAISHITYLGFEKKKIVRVWYLYSGGVHGRLVG